MVSVRIGCVLRQPYYACPAHRPTGKTGIPTARNRALYDDSVRTEFPDPA